jgi:hypothetical protein
MSGAISTNGLSRWEKDQWELANDLCSSTNGLFFVAGERCQRASYLFFSAEAVIPTREAVFLSAEDLDKGHRTFSRFLWTFAKSQMTVS